MGEYLGQIKLFSTEEKQGTKKKKVESSSRERHTHKGKMYIISKFRIGKGFRLVYADCNCNMKITSPAIKTMAFDM